MSIILEACIDSVEAAIAAQKGGTQRVELCANLLEGGTTPSAGTIQLARQSIDIGIMVMIRPRGGDFCYTSVELEVMKLNIELAKTAGADGVVFGILNPDGTVDRERTAELIELARPLEVTCHRAFDMTRDPLAALETLVDLGVDRILTSGQEISALEGLDLITELVQRAQDRLVIMPGGGITERNVSKIVMQSKVQEVHIAAPVEIASRMEYRHDRCFMGGELRPAEFSLSVTSANRIRAFSQAIQQR